MVICLEQVADLHMSQLMPLTLTVSCFSKIQIGFTFLVPAHLGCPKKGPLNGCVCVPSVKSELVVEERVKSSTTISFPYANAPTQVHLHHSTTRSIKSWRSSQKEFETS